MGSLTVAPLDNYVITSELSAPDNYASLMAPRQLSVTLTDSTLWLVDISKLRAETLSTGSLETGIVDQPVTISNQLTVPFANKSYEAEPITLGNAFANLPDNWSAMTLTQDSSLQLAAFSGNVQLSSSSSTGGFSSGGGLTSSSTFIGSISPITGTDPIVGGGGSLPISGGGGDGGGDGGDGGGGGGDGGGGGGNTIIGVPPKDVPFEFSQTAGLLLVLGFFGIQKVLKSWSNWRIATK